LRADLDGADKLGSRHKSPRPDERVCFYLSGSRRRSRAYFDGTFERSSIERRKKEKKKREKRWANIEESYDLVVVEGAGGSRANDDISRRGPCGTLET